MKPHFIHATQEGVLILVHLQDKHDDKINKIEVQSGVFILAVSIKNFYDRYNYQIAITGNYLAVRRVNEGDLHVQKFSLKEGECKEDESYGRKTIVIDEILKDGEDLTRYTMCHVPQLSQYNIKKRVNGKPTEFFSSLLQIYGPTYLAIIDLE